MTSTKFELTLSSLYLFGSKALDCHKYSALPRRLLYVRIVHKVSALQSKRGFHASQLNPNGTKHLLRCTPRYTPNADWCSQHLFLTQHCSQHGDGQMMLAALM